jgi:dTMP kinase
MRAGRARRPGPRYVVIEGIDGAGKSELSTRLRRALVGQGFRVAPFREPSRPAVRRAALRLQPKDPIAAAIAFTVDRLLQRPRVERALEGGAIVVQDRSFYSTLAYQGAALPRAARDHLEQLERSAALAPDLVLYLDLPVLRALDRLEARGARDRFERAAFLRRVRREFGRFRRDPGWTPIDASGPPEATLAAALSALGRAGLPVGPRPGRPRGSRRTAV